MTQYDNEFFRGPPEELPTLATDQGPTGAEIFQARPEKATAVADISVTRETVPKEPPKKKSNARRITKAIKLLASCMAAVVITEAATNIAATIEVPEEVPTGDYYVGQWPGVEPSHGGVYKMDIESELGYSIQIPMDGNIWRLTADEDWRMCWLDGNRNTAYIEMHNQRTDVYLAADLQSYPHTSDHEEDSYTILTTPTGETIYVRAFFLGLGQYEDEYGLSEEALAASAEFRQRLVHEIFAGIQVTAGTDNGWQALEIGEKIYSQQGPEWYGLGGFGDLEIHMPWVNYAEDYNLQNMTPYARKNINGITWSIYFAENDTYLWAVPNVDPEICLGGLTSRFMCADAVRRGEYINDDEWLEMGGFTSVSQRQTAVDILVECLQHHYALRDRWYPRDWPWKGPTETATYWVWAESVRGTWIQFSFGDEAYRLDTTDPELRFHWERTTPTGDIMKADLEISRMVRNEEEYAIDLTVCRTPFVDKDEECAYKSTSASGGETLYLEFRPQCHGSGPDFTSAEMEVIAEQILGSITFESNPDNSGWSKMLLCDTMHSPQTMEWSGSGIVGSYNQISYIHPVEVENLENETLCGVHSYNGITWTFYYDEDEEMADKIIWAVPDIEPDVCIGASMESARDYYRQYHPSWSNDGWNSQYNVSADIIHAVEGFAEALSHIYPLGVEPEVGWYIPDWPMIGQISEGAGYNLMEYSRYGTFSQFSLGERSYRLESNHPQLRFFWNRTSPVVLEMQANLLISHMANGRRDWSATLLVQEAPFEEARDEDSQLDTVITVSDGSRLYLRFQDAWPNGDLTLAERATLIMDALTASPADPNGWGQVWICDLMTTPLSENWDGNEMVVDENYRFHYFNRVEDRDLGVETPYKVKLNGIVWSFYYAEAEDLIWAVPDIESRWCIGAYAKDMAIWGVDMDADTMDSLSENDYIFAAAEGMSEGLSRYYPRRGFSMTPQEEAIWPSILAENNADYGMEYWSNQTTAGIFSLDGAVFEINSYREDLRFWWMHGSADTASVAIYSIPEDGYEAWIILADIRRTPFDTDSEGYQCYRTVQLPGNENLYLGINALILGDQTLEEVVDELQSLLAFDYCGKEESWHTVNIGRTLQTQQGYDWTGLAMVYEDYEFRYVHYADAFEVHQQDYVGQQTINGIRWTFRFHKDNDVIYAYPESEPELCIGADPGKMYQLAESQYGGQMDYFEAIVEGMSVGLRNYHLRPGVELDPEPELENDPITYTPDQSNTIQISLGDRGYYLKSDLEDAWLIWYFTREHDGVMAADMSVGTDCGAQVYISEMPMAMYDHRSHGQIPVENGGTLYWYCIEMFDGTEAQLADLMNGLTAADASYSQWGGVVIEDSLYSRQSLEWSGWETVEPDGSRTVMMWNLERPASLELGDPVDQQKINGIVWTLYITPEHSSERWPFIWAVPDVNPNLAIGSDYENAVYRYYEVKGMAGGFDGDLWSTESIYGAVETIIEVLSNYYPR